MAVWAPDFDQRMVASETTGTVAGAHHGRRLCDPFVLNVARTLKVGYRIAPIAAADKPWTVSQGVRRHWRIALLALAAIVLVVAGVYGILRERATRTVTVPAPAGLTLAVLPFTPLDSDPQAQRFGDTIASNVADMLSSSALDVVSPERALQFHGEAKANAAQALHADFLIDGDYHRENGAVVVWARIVDGRNGTTIIADKFSQLAGEDSAVPQQERAKMAAFLLGTVPYVGSAVMPEGKMELLAEARTAANKAIEIKPRTGDAYAVLSLTTPIIDWARREAYLRKALALDPDAAVAQSYLTELLLNAGRFGDATPYANSMLIRARYKNEAAFEMIDVKLWRGDVAGALAGINEALGLFPQKQWLAVKTFEATAFSGSPADADKLVKDTTVEQRLDPKGAPPVFADIAAALRDRNKIETVAEDCRKFEGVTLYPGGSSDSQSGQLYRAQTCLIALTVFRRLDDAFRIAGLLYPDQRAATPAAVEQRWLATHVYTTAYLLIPPTAPLRADPRFKDVVERIGLLQYWKVSRRLPDFCAKERAPVCKLLKSG